eukprot:tig00020944_g16343.t1
MPLGSRRCVGTRDTSAPRRGELALDAQALLQLSELPPSSLSELPPPPVVRGGGGGGAGGGAGLAFPSSPSRRRRRPSGLERGNRRLLEFAAARSSQASATHASCRRRPRSAPGPLIAHQVVTTARIVRGGTATPVQRLMACAGTRGETHRRGGEEMYPWSLAPRSTAVDGARAGRAGAHLELLGDGTITAPCRFCGWGVGGARPGAARREAPHRRLVGRTAAAPRRPGASRRATASATGAGGEPTAGEAARSMGVSGRASPSLPPSSPSASLSDDDELADEDEGSPGAAGPAASMAPAPGGARLDAGSATAQLSTSSSISNRRRSLVSTMALSSKDRNPMEPSFRYSSHEYCVAASSARLSANHSAHIPGDREAP